MESLTCILLFSSEGIILRVRVPLFASDLRVSQITPREPPDFADFLQSARPPKKLPRARRRNLPKSRLGCAHGTHVRIFDHMCVNIYIYIYIYIVCICRVRERKREREIHTYIHAYIHTYIHAYIHTYIHACMHACIHTCIHTYTHTYIA